MALRVIVPPDPIVTPAELGSDYASDPAASLIISSVTGKYDGPSGTLGRCIGPQTLELIARANGDCVQLPCGPVIEIEAVSFVSDDTETPIDDGTFRLNPRGMLHLVGPLPNVSGDWIKIRYRAGYDGEETGAIPDPLKQAVILEARLLLKMVDTSLFVKADQVDGVGRTEYTLPEQVSRVIENAVANLVSGFKVSQI